MQLTLTLEPLGKSGPVEEHLTIVTDSALTPSVDVPVFAQVRHAGATDVGAALQDRLFGTECAECHGARASTGRSGADLYDAVCAMCHPDPSALTSSGEALRAVIAEGDFPNNMPAYGRASGGPLSERQLDSLVTYIEAE